MIRIGLLLICSFSVFGSTIVSADHPAQPAKTAPTKGRMFLPFSRIVHNNRPYCQRLAAWMCYRAARVPHDAKFLYLRPVPVEQPPMYTYFAWMDIHGTCAGCQPSQVEAAPAIHLMPPIEK